MRVLLDAALLEGQAEGSLQGGAIHGTGGGEGAQSAVAFGGKEQTRVAVGFPEITQKHQRALG